MDAKTDDKSAGKCPVVHSSGRLNRDWWPKQLNIGVLHHNTPKSDPMGEAFDYAKEFDSLDLDAVIKDLHALMTDSQEWWPRWPADASRHRASRRVRRPGAELCAPPGSNRNKAGCS